MSSISSSLTDNYEGVYRDFNHNAPEGLLRRVKRGAAGTTAFTLFGTYHASELEDDGNWLSDGPVAAGDKWEVPVSHDGTAMFAGHKSARTGQLHANYHVKGARDQDDLTLEFYPLTGPDAGMKVNTWIKLKDGGSGVEDLARADTLRGRGANA